MTNLQLVRKQLADDYKFAFDENDGDGATEIFRLTHGNIQAATYEVQVDGAVQTDATDYTLDLERGILEFATAPTTGDIIQIKYYFSAFSDTEITEFLSLNSTVNKTVLALIEILIADTARRFDYTSGQTEMKPSQVFDNLLRLRDVYKEKVDKDNHGYLSMVTRRHPHYANETQERGDISRYDSLDND
jgi:hypothetical protein